MDIALETEAEARQLEGSLWIDLRRFEDAESLLTRALDIYQELGEVSSSARTLIVLGHLRSCAGDYEAAETPYRAALRLVSPDDQPWLYLAARLNLSHTLFELGELTAARDLLAYDEDLFAAYADSHMAVRVTWLRGRIAARAGEMPEAEGLLTEARNTFAADGQGFYVAILSLDLAMLYHHQHRRRELAESVGSAIESFGAYALHREALAALMMLRDAVLEERVTAESIRRVAAYLRDVQADPAARTSRPS